MLDFLTNLDDYFCENYANYDRLCILPGYKMPVMQTTMTDEFGRTRAYTLPPSTMRLALQENKAEILKELKARLTDATFSFSFQPVGIFQRIRDKFSQLSFAGNLKKMLQRYGISMEEAGAELNIDGEIWTKICKGALLPTKNLIFSLALTSQLSLTDTQTLLLLCDEEFDYAIVKDTVISYLLHSKVYNRTMIDAALKEYKVGNLFIK